MAFGFTYTLPTITGSHTDFVIVLKTADFPSAALDGTVNALDNGGGNLVAYTDDGKGTQIPVHVVTLVSSGSPDAEVWVKLPTAATSNTIFIEGDDVQTSQPAADSTFGSEAVWSGSVLSSVDGGATDATANDNDGTAEGGVTIGGASGKFGVATDFDGTNDFIDIATETNLSFNASTDDFSYFCWIKTADTGRGILMGDFDSRPAITLEYRDDGSLRLFIEDSTTNTVDYDTGSTLIDDDTFHRVGFTYFTSGQVKELYIDGVEITADVNQNETLSGTVDNSGTLKLGKDNRSGSHFVDGLMHGFLVSSSPLSADAIKTEFENQDATSAWGTVGAWEAAGTEILVTTDNLIITENAVTVNAATNILATTDTLIITELAATVGLGTNILATTDSLVITEFQASINAETNVLATTDALILTEFPASIAEATEILATTDNLVITEQQASINAATNVNATTDSLVITENATTISLGVNVSATTDSLVITEQAASINAATNILATTAVLTITEFEATITGAVPGSALIDGAVSQTITANFGEMTLYFSGTNYFRI